MENSRKQDIAYRKLILNLTVSKPNNDRNKIVFLFPLNALQIRIISNFFHILLTIMKTNRCIFITSPCVINLIGWYGYSIVGSCCTNVRYIASVRKSNRLFYQSHSLPCMTTNGVLVVIL